MQWIQKHVLKELSTAKKLRYSEMIPEAVEGNLFMYHLKQLMNTGYIQKDGNSYALTADGKRFVGEMSLASGKQTITPKTLVMIYGKNKDNELLLYKWNRQPYFDHVSLPFSRVRYGETISKAANDTLKNKTNLSGKLGFIGTINVIVKKNNTVTTHYVAYIYGVEIQSEPSADGLTGKPFLGNIKDFDSELVDGTKEIVEIIENKKSPFFEEILVEK